MGEYPRLGEEDVGHLKEKVTELAVMPVESARLAWKDSFRDGTSNKQGPSFKRRRSRTIDPFAEQDSGSTDSEEEYSVKS